MIAIFNGEMYIYGRNNNSPQEILKIESFQ